MRGDFCFQHGETTSENRTRQHIIARTTRMNKSDYYVPGFASLVLHYPPNHGCNPNPLEVYQGRHRVYC